MKIEVDSAEKVAAWLSVPQPAVFQGQNLIRFSEQILALKPGSLNGCVFLGCALSPELSNAAVKSNCMIVPRIDSVPFDAFKTGLYTPAELYDQFDSADPDGSYPKCLDRKIYESYINPATKEIIPVDLDVMIARRIHDASITDALGELLNLKTRLRTVAIMGGHDVPRDKPVFCDIARLCQELSSNGYLVLTGGGPGLMEAANLGAYTAGFSDPAKVLNDTIAILKTAPIYNDPQWLSAGYKAWKAMGLPSKPEISRTIGIPTWFYGHEPPNVFATHIAKFFENSIREECLLALALAGVIFAEGNAGTVQEIFQDACQNYYRTYDKKQSPMILFGVDYWAPAHMVRDTPKDKRKNAYPLLEKLASEMGFSNRLLLTDDISAIVKFIKENPPA
jgi:predicted Rossmann-fold nucleotide-binding protein